MYNSCNCILIEGVARNASEILHLFAIVPILVIGSFRDVLEFIESADDIVCVASMMCREWKIKNGS